MEEGCREQTQSGVGIPGKGLTISEASMWESNCIFLNQRKHVPCEAPQKQVLAQKSDEILGGGKLVALEWNLSTVLLVGSR